MGLLWSFQCQQGLKKSNFVLCLRTHIQRLNHDYDPKRVQLVWVLFRSVETPQVAAQRFRWHLISSLKRLPAVPIQMVSNPVVTRMLNFPGLCFTRRAPESRCSKVVSGSRLQHQIILYWPCDNWETSAIHLHYVTGNRSFEWKMMKSLWWINDQEENSSAPQDHCRCHVLPMTRIYL